MPAGAAIWFAVGPIEAPPGQDDVGDAARAAWALKAISPTTDAANPTLMKEIEVIGAPKPICLRTAPRKKEQELYARRQLPLPIVKAALIPRV
jgi:hypothetical protein